MPRYCFQEFLKLGDSLTLLSVTSVCDMHNIIAHKQGSDT